MMTLSPKESIKKSLQKTRENFIDLFRRVTALESGGGGGGGASVIEVTKAEIDVLIANGELVVGSAYKISGVDTALYGGTTIMLQAVETDELSLDGVGIFYNPKYDDTVSGFNVFDDAGVYIVGDRVHWGGKTWVNLNGNTGIPPDVNYEYELSADWTALPFDAVEYNVAYDAIKYDYENDLIVERNENNSNIVSCDRLTVQLYGKSPIRAFMWGNNPTIFEDLYIYTYYGRAYGSYTPTFSADIFGIANNRIINSLNENINFKGLASYNITMIENSQQVRCIFKTGSYQVNISLSGKSQQFDLVFENGSYQEDIILTDNTIQKDVKADNSSQTHLRMNKSVQQSLTLINAAQSFCLFDDGSQFNTSFTDCTQANCQFLYGGVQQQCAFSVGSHQRHCKFIGENAEQRRLTSALGHIQERIVFEDYYSERLALNPTATEADLIYSPRIITKPFLVADLPDGITPNLRYVGMKCFVTDATAPTYGATIAGAGAVFSPVIWDGSNWIVG